MVSVQLLGIPGKFGGGVHCDGRWLHHIRTIRTHESAAAGLLSAVFDGASDHDRALETNCGILAAVCGVVCSVLVAAVAGRQAQLSNEVAGGCAGRVAAF